MWFTKTLMRFAFEISTLVFVGAQPKQPEVIAAVYLYPHAPRLLSEQAEARSVYLLF